MLWASQVCPTHYLLLLHIQKLSRGGKALSEKYCELGVNRLTCELTTLEVRVVNTFIATFLSESLETKANKNYEKLYYSNVLTKVQYVFSSGCVIGPTFHFDVNKIKFGTVSYGFLNTFTCTLTNTALVPMTFNLRVPGDGLADSSSASEMESTFSEAGSLIPKEFEITPSRGKYLHVYYSF